MNDKRIEGISESRDESDRDGMRVVIELKRDAEPNIVLNQLYKLTQMQQSYGIIMLGIHEGRPARDDAAARCWWRSSTIASVLTRRTQFELKAGRGAPAHPGGPADRAAEPGRGDQADSRVEGRRDARAPA